MSTVLEDAGIDLDKLQEIPLETDPEEQALKRARAAMVHTAMQRWLDLKALVRRFAPVLIQCGFCEQYFDQSKMSYKVTRALALAIPGPVAIAIPGPVAIAIPGPVAIGGSPACAVDVKRPVKEWIDLAKARRRR